MSASPSERGLRRPLHAVLWALFILVPVFGIWVMSFMGIGALLAGLVFFGLFAAVGAIKAWAAWTGAKRVG